MLLTTGPNRYPLPRLATRITTFINYPSRRRPLPRHHRYRGTAAVTCAKKAVWAIGKAISETNGRGKTTSMATQLREALVPKSKGHSMPKRAETWLTARPKTARRQTQSI